MRYECFTVTAVVVLTLSAFLAFEQWHLAKWDIISSSIIIHPSLLPSRTHPHPPTTSKFQLYVHPAVRPSVRPSLLPSGSHLHIRIPTVRTSVHPSIHPSIYLHERFRLLQVKVPYAHLIMSWTGKDTPFSQTKVSIMLASRVRLFILHICWLRSFVTKPKPKLWAFSSLELGLDLA